MLLLVFFSVHDRVGILFEFGVLSVLVIKLLEHVAGVPLDKVIIIILLVVLEVLVQEVVLPVFIKFILCLLLLLSCWI